MNRNKNRILMRLPSVKRDGITIAEEHTLADRIRCRVFNAIDAERERQNKLFVEGELPFAVCSQTPDDNRKLRVLVEEVGEVAQEIDDLEYAILPAIEKAVRKRLQTELVQVAAVAVAWLEALACHDEAGRSREVKP